MFEVGRNPGSHPKNPEIFGSFKDLRFGGSRHTIITPQDEGRSGFGGTTAVYGEVSEWLKEHAWKACVGVTLPWVRIPPSPPHYISIIPQLIVIGIAIGVYLNPIGRLFWEAGGAMSSRMASNTILNRASYFFSRETSLRAKSGWAVSI
jgi:hypothetical protein